MMLKKIREEIDQIDKKIIKLLEKRISLAAETKSFKKKFKDRKRENEILQKIKCPYLRAIYKSIFKNITKKAMRKTSK